MTAPGIFFLGQTDRLYGAFYGNSPTAQVWQEYAKADRRWGGSDLGVISLELLTVFLMGPLAFYVFTLLARAKYKQAWFWACIIATSELYGGFMTFAPEWLTGSPNLSTNNWLHLWIYLFFMNSLWVWIPIWILYQGYLELVVEGTIDSTVTKKKQ